MENANKRIFFVVIFIVVTGLAWSFWNYFQEKNCRVIFFDVGQGDSIFIETPEHKQILIDGGPDNTVMQRLGEVMPWWDRTIDIVILTHSDSDHINGLLEVLNRYAVAAIIENPFDPGTTATKKIWENLIVQKKVQYISAKSGDQWAFGAAGTFVILSAKQGKTVNESSIVLLFQYGNKKFLFEADVTQEEEHEMIQKICDTRENCDNFDIDVLKVAHHGSMTASANNFLRIIKPEYSVILVGNKNKFGHPDQSVMKRLKNIGSLIFRTDMQGSIIFETDGENILLPDCRIQGTIMGN